MCGRYVNVATTSDLVDEFDVEEVLDDDVPPSWNVAPTDPVRGIARRVHKDDPDSGAHTQLRTFRWGLVPSWSKDRKGGAKMINARIETVTAKPAFAKAAAKRRCLLPSLGYYEWQNTDEGKVPWFLHEPDCRLLAMAGLYEFWRDPALPDDDPNAWLLTCTVITQPATDLLGYIHDRTPVVVPAEMWDEWLDCSSEDADVAQRLLDRIPQVRLQPDVVSSLVNSVKNNGPELIEPVDESRVAAPEPQQLF
ncbi:MAG TPA: SOS response-associated peptidase [Jatrophihabitantaceae bacterium]|nr:SOS response-associated peptidase [Jatrophihabitantaceae bacterium]